MGTYALPATAATGEVVHRGALPESPVGHGEEHVVVALDRACTDDQVVAQQPDPPDSARRTAHGTHVLLREPDSLAVARHHEQVVASRGREHPHQLVAVAQSDRYQTIAARAVIGVECGLLDHTLAGHEEEVAVCLVVAGVDDRFDALLGGEVEQVHDGLALGIAVPLWDPVGLEPVDLAPIGEEQQVRVRRGVEQVCDHVLLAQLRPGDTPAAAALGAEGIGRNALQVATIGHQHHDVLVVDEILDIEVAVVVFEGGAPRGRELLADVGEFGGDRGPESPVVGEDRLEFRDGLAQLRQLLVQAFPTQPGEGGQPHVDDLGGLDLAEAEGFVLQCHDRSRTVS